MVFFTEGIQWANNTLSVLGNAKSKPDEMPLYIDKNGYSLKNRLITIVDMAMEKLKLYGEIVRNKAV